MLAGLRFGSESAQNGSLVYSTHGPFLLHCFSPTASSFRYHDVLVISLVDSPRTLLVVSCLLVYKAGCISLYHLNVLRLML